MISLKDSGAAGLLPRCAPWVILGPLLGLVLGTLGTGCTREPDARFASADATLGTLLRAYGIDRMSESAVAAHMQGGGRFTLQDEDDFHACFADYRGPADEGLAGFVFGRIAPKKDSIVVEAAGDRAHVFFKGMPKEKPVAVLVRSEEADGWRFSLKESVPAEIRERLHDLYRRAEAAHRRQGPSR